MNYYILDKEGNIALFDVNKSKLETTLKFMPQYAGQKIKSTSKEIVILDGKFVFADEHQDEILQNAKAEKLEEVESKSNSFNENLCKEMIITSSLGGRFDADLRSQTNIQGLIDLGLDDNLYRDADNNFIKLSNAQLKLLKGEMVQNGLSLYQQKWTLQAKIQAAKTLEELEAIEVVFIMADFSKKGDA